MAQQMIDTNSSNMHLHQIYPYEDVVHCYVTHGQYEIKRGPNYNNSKVLFFTETPFQNHMNILMLRDFRNNLLKQAFLHNLIFLEIGRYSNVKMGFKLDRL